MYDPLMMTLFVAFALVQCVANIAWTIGWNLLYRRTRARHALAGSIIGSLGIAGCVVFYVACLTDGWLRWADEEELFGFFMFLFATLALHGPCLAIHAWWVARPRKVHP